MVLIPQRIFKIASIFYCTDAFIWRIKDAIYGGDTLRYSEHYMFTTNDGPPLMEQGDSFIEINAKVNVRMYVNETPSFAVAVYGAKEGYHQQFLDDTCESSSSFLQGTNSWSYDVQVRHFQECQYIQNVSTNQYYGYNMNHNITLYQYIIPIHRRLIVMEEGWHTLQFTACEGMVNIADAVLEGDLIFKNPYGYIQTDLYGLLPFEAARMITYVFLGAILAYFYFQFKESLMILHMAVLIVYIFALTESVVWYATYQRINLTGEPYCCPFPSLVIASLILQVIRQLLSRTLLLVICLGYGIARPKLLRVEWICVAVISILYFAAAMFVEVTEIMHTYDLTRTIQSFNTLYRLPVLIMDIIFLSWITISLQATQRILQEFQQLHKLQIYRKIYISMGIFGSIFFVITIFDILGQFDVIRFPWQVVWLPDVIWESLNFIVILTLCLLTLPNESSRYLAYGTQIPNFDIDDSDFDDVLPKYFEDTDDEGSVHSGKHSQDTQSTNDGAFHTSSSSGIEMKNMTSTTSKISNIPKKLKARIQKKVVNEDNEDFDFEMD